MTKLNCRTLPIYVVVLYNFRAPTHLPEFLAGDLAALAIGKPFDISEISVDESLLRTYVGVYEEEGVDRLVTVDSGNLYYQRVGANKMSMKPNARDKFFFENTAVVGEFRRDDQNNITGLELANKRGISRSVLRRTHKAVPVAK